MPGVKSLLRSVRCLFRDNEAPSGRGRNNSGELIPFTLEPGDGGSTLWGTLRRSPRSRRVRLIVDERGLTVTVPMSFHFKRDLSALLEKHISWILKSVDKVSLRQKAVGRYPLKLPGHISLPLLDETWNVELVPAESARFMPGESFSPTDGGVLRLSRDLSVTEALKVLRVWLKLRARETLPPLLMELAMEMGVPPGGVARVFVKEMKSRWGSCSSRRNINLNARLLFLPQDLVRHVMLHELCHLAEMNHGAAFYTRLNAADPEAARHIAELRTAWRLIPAWATEPL